MSELLGHLELRGKVVTLKQLRPADAELTLKFRNSELALAHMPGLEANIEKQEQWIKRVAKDPNQLNFKIVHLSTGHAVGIISIYDIMDGRAEWGRWVVASAGISSLESCFLVHDFAFGELGLTAIYCRTSEFNERPLAFTIVLGVNASKLKLTLFSFKEKAV